jgi:hypothetical protein
VEQSYLAIEQFPAGLVLYYHVPPGATCTLQQSTQFSTWEDVETKAADGNGLVVFSVANPLSAPQLFFRIKLAP